VTVPRRRLAAALTPILVGVLAAVIAGAAPQPPARTASGPAAVLLNCAGKQQVRPAQIVLACADGSAYLSGLHWASWQSLARASGTWRINDCTPYCARGTFHSFPAVVTLRRPAPLPGHRNVRHYTRITIALPGSRCYQAGDARACYPASYTGELWSVTKSGLPVNPRTGPPAGGTTRLIPPTRDLVT
jgi:hypothetical protein